MDAMVHRNGAPEGAGETEPACRHTGRGLVGLDPSGQLVMVGGLAGTSAPFSYTLGQTLLVVLALMFVNFAPLVTMMYVNTKFVLMMIVIAATVLLSKGILGWPGHL